MKLLFICLLWFFSFSKAVAAPEIELTELEQAYIIENPVVSVGVMPDFTPFSYYIESTLVGFEHDLLRLISERTGLQFEMKIDKWTNIYNAFKNKEIDMISSISYKKFREPFTVFTSAYYEIPIMIFVRDDFGDYLGIKSLHGKKVGVLKDVFYVKEIEKIKGIDIVYYDNYEQLTKDLVFGKVDALIQNLTNINYLIKKNVYRNLKLASELTLPNTKNEDLRFGVQPKNVLLSSIIQKSLNSISHKEKESLVDKWMGSIKEYSGEHIELTDMELAYLDSHVIKYCINPNGLPLEGFNEKGEHIGMSSDYYSLFKKILSAKFEIVKTKDWNQSMNYIEQKKCDMLAFSMETLERKEFLNFTSDFIEVPLVVATRVDGPFINNILDLEGQKIGITRGDAFVKILREKYPSLDLVEVDGVYDGLDSVKDGELFGYIDTLVSIGYEFQNRYFGELKIAGKISEELKLSMAVVKEDEILLNILQKIVNNLSNHFHREVFNKWIPVKYEKGINYSLVWKVALIALFFLIIISYWNRKVIKANHLLKEAKLDIEQKNRELEKLATTDKLTSLYNRRKIDELLQIEVNRSNRFNHTFGVVILDLDYFKKVNDKFGHQVGDKVLKELSTLLAAQIRKTDFIGRFGGEEFLIICPESDAVSIYKLMETIRLELSSQCFTTVGTLTVSMGISIFKPGDDIDSLIKRADTALYKAKDEGRNRVESCDFDISTATVGNLETLA
ncbi:transporter substrate-binding domain-containing protein [uncultured Vibrio sp.]|uniref:transporter substrate-binding domain-containing diguanylate cyclase n=1 Tax=uncultured Vibrio sp. TaxID=114054 RepID=UPI0025CC5431|nr:transporter substrate-binding domain-containing protein [uncultured Vibrio sp.]